MTEDKNSEFNRIDRRLRLLTKIFWGIAGASMVVMFFSVVVATLVILMR